MSRNRLLPVPLAGTSPWQAILAGAIGRECPRVLGMNLGLLLRETTRDSL